MKTEQQPKVLYSKALSGSLPPTQPQPPLPVVVPAPIALPPPPTGLISPSGGGGGGGPSLSAIPPPSVVGVVPSHPPPLSSPSSSASAMASNVSALVGSNLYHSGGGGGGGGGAHHKGGAGGGGSQFGGGGGGLNGRNSGYVSPSGNIRGLGSGGGGGGGKGSGGQSPYSNRHSQQPYQNSRMPSNTSSASPPMASVGGGGGSGHSPNASNGSNGNGGSGVTNGNGSATPEGKSSLLSDHTDRSGGGAGGDVRGDHHGGGGSMHHHHHHHGGGGGGHRPPAISKTNLYIRGLTPNTTDKDLHALCSPYGNIISTKAILDKETNKCRGYGFVDFEHPNSAELAVKSLISQGVQAQMAKCSEASRQKAFSLSKGGGGGLGSGGLGGGGGNGGGAGGSINEHDPTNLYIANLPLSMTEHDLEAMLTMYGSVVSTRILKDSNGAPRGVGFARMESKEKCDAIINLLNGRMLPGCKDLLLVKFADGGNKKKHYKHNGGGDRGYRNDVDLQMNFDSTNLATNGVPTQLLPSPLGAAAAASAYQRAAAFSAAAASAAGPYQNALQANPWLVAANQVNPPHGAYIMQPQMIPSNMDPNAALQYSPLMHQLTAQMSHLQLGGVSGAGYMPSAAHAYGAQALYPQQLIQSMTLPGEESINPSHSVSSGSASGEDPQQQVQQVQQQQQQQQQQQHSYQQQQMAYASQLQK